MHEVQLVENILHKLHYGAQAEHILFWVRSIYWPSGHDVKQLVPDK